MRKGYAFGAMFLAMTAGMVLASIAPGAFAAVEAATGTSVVVTNTPLLVVERGRLVSLAQNVTLLPDATFTSPYNKTEDCGHITVYVRSNETSNGQLSLELLPSPDQTNGWGQISPVASSGQLGGDIYYFAPISSSGAPGVAPFVAIQFANSTNTTSDTFTATLFCMP
jgi:hypothetical protein